MTSRRAFLRSAIALPTIAAGTGWAIEAVRAEERLALRGYDPVAYFTDSRATPGKEEYEYVFDGQRYRFANARHRDLFKANPDRYAPQFGGSCAMNLSRGVVRESDPNNWVISNGNLYVFASAAGRQRFAQAPADIAQQAGANWRTISSTVAR